AILKQDDAGNNRINQTPSNQAITLLKRFISNHMNEALNPSSLEYLQYIFVKKAVLNRCGLWQKRYPDPVMLNDKASNLKYWNEDSYGFKTKNTVSIYESCFISPRQLVDEDRRLVSITPS
ncbi:MAG: hypothetical protein GY951_08215, partial [Psychromonas sp.]|nr:hypothetical protein [Psychromonas sp.]